MLYIEHISESGSTRAQSEPQRLLELELELLLLLLEPLDGSEGGSAGVREGE